MKKILSLVLILVVQVAIAKPTPPVLHSHNGRFHKHSLPAIGVKHRHGGGQAGVLAKNSNLPSTITSSVIYDDVPRTKPEPHVKAPYVTSFIKGDTNCKKGDADCNVCANNIQQQFARASAGQLKWRKKSWYFTWAKNYPLFGIRPLDVFDGDPAYPLGIPNKHIQGFARTNSERFPFVGTHSHKKKGGVFVVSRDSSGRKNLVSLQQSKGGHPSGVQVIGRYLVYGDNGSLVFKDITSPNNKNTIRIKITPKDKYSVGGGLGLLRLSKNNLLVLTSGPGSQDSSPRYNYFYHLQLNNGVPTKLSLINKSRLAIPKQWPKSLRFSENLSLITECGTGDLYSIHTTGDSKGLGAVTGNGYWRLSKLIQSKGKLSLYPLRAFATRQNMPNCSLSSAATVSVNKQHQLEFYCHGFAKDPSGSTFNVLGSPSRNGQDKFDFKVGTLK